MEGEREIREHNWDEEGSEQSEKGRIGRGDWKGKGIEGREGGSKQGIISREKGRLSNEELKGDKKETKEHKTGR